MRKFLAVLVAVSLLIASPGLNLYQAWAGVFANAKAGSLGNAGSQAGAQMGSQPISHAASSSDLLLESWALKSWAQQPFLFPEDQSLVTVDVIPKPQLLQAMEEAIDSSPGKSPESRRTDSGEIQAMMEGERILRSDASLVLGHSLSVSAKPQGLSLQSQEKKTAQVSPLPAFSRDIPPGKYTRAGLLGLGLALQPALALAGQTVPTDLRRIFLIPGIIIAAIVAVKAIPLYLRYRSAKAERQNFEYLFRKAEAGDPGAQYELGIRLLKKDNVEEAFQWLIEAGDKEYASAREKILEMYLDGYGLNFSDSAQIEEWHKKAAVKIEGWYINAAVKGDAEAQNTLGRLYLKSKDYSKAEKWLRQATEQNHPAAMENLAGLYFKLGMNHYMGSNGMLRNNGKAMQWFLQAARETGVYAHYSQYLLGVMNETGLNGLVLDKDQRRFEAYKWYLLAAAHGGLIESSVRNSRESDYELYAFFSQLFDLGDPNWDEFLMLLPKPAYNRSKQLRGQGRPGKRREALESILTLEQIAEAQEWALDFYKRHSKTPPEEAGNDPNKLLYLGEVYYLGIEGIPRNYAKAIESLLKAAQTKTPYAHGAQYILGVMHAQGKGVPKDNIEAYKWLLLAERDPHSVALTQRAINLASSRLEWIFEGAPPSSGETERKLTAEQRAAGQLRAQKFLESLPPNLKDSSGLTGIVALLGIPFLANNAMAQGSGLGSIDPAVFTLSLLFLGFGGTFLVRMAWNAIGLRSEKARFNRGVMHYENGEFTKAAQLLKEFAKGYIHVELLDGRDIEEETEKTAQANYRMGMMYELGRGVPRDLIMAYKAYDCAEHFGASEASARLDHLLKKLTKEQKHLLARSFTPDYPRMKDLLEN